MSSSLSFPQANLKMTLWQVESDYMSNNDLYVWLDNTGLAPEVALRLHELVSHTKIVGSKTIAIGKIILVKIIEFIKAHPNLSTGIALGVAVGLLVNSIPIIGSVLAPLAAALGITLGAIAGHRLDQENKGLTRNLNLMGITQDVIEIARIFFDLVIDVFNTIFPSVANA